MKVIYLSLVVLLLSIAPTVAQDEQSDRIFPDSKDIPQAEDSKSSNSGLRRINERTILKDKYLGKYKTSNLKNVSKLYWKKGMMDIQNNKMIDDFIMINECDFYKENNSNDFKWAKAREAARLMIKDQISTYSDKFQIILPIDLGHYDTERKGFPLVNGTAFNNPRRVEVGGLKRTDKVCGKVGYIEGYPKDVTAILNKPFDFDFLKMDEHIAQAFIIRYNNGLTSQKGRSFFGDRKFNRFAFARIRMTFTKFAQIEKRRNDFPTAVMFGQIDGIEVFESLDETGLLYSEDFIKVKKKKEEDKTADVPKQVVAE